MSEPSKAAAEAAKELIVKANAVGSDVSGIQRAEATYRAAAEIVLALDRLEQQQRDDNHWQQERLLELQQAVASLEMSTRARR